MNFKNLVNENLVLLNLDLKDKKDIIKVLVDKLYDNGRITSKEIFYKTVMERELSSPTGLEEGLAIPHGKDECVKEASIAIARLKNPISTWESVDEDNEVNLVFLIAIPKKEEGSSHIEILSKLTTSFMKEGFIQDLQNSQTTKELLNIVYSIEEEKNENTNENTYFKDKPLILAVTACPTGIAHTYLAAEALEKAAKELQINICVEKQGARGIEGRHSEELITKADVIIFATDVSVKEKERFIGKKYIQTRVAAPLKKGKETILEALNNPDGIIEANQIKSENNTDDKNENSNKLFSLQEIKRACLTGISYMLPLVVAGAVIMGLSRIGASFFEIGNIWDSSYAQSSEPLVRLLHTLDKLGGKTLSLMLPFIGGYVAFAIGDKVAIAPGFVGGLLAADSNSGFLGALVAGILAGYSTKIIIKKVKLPAFASGVTSIFIAPICAVLITGLSIIYVIGDPVATLNKSLEIWLMGMNGSNRLILAAIIGGMMGADLGGPINKAALTTALALVASGITVPNTAAMIGIVVPPLGLGFATILSKKKYSLALQEAGKSAILMGLVGVTEGAIPFAIESPIKVISSTILGSALAAALAVYLGANNPLPISGFYGWFAVQNWPIYILSIFIGSLFIAIMNISLRKEESKENV
ncbi:fructose-specific PTS transporter subunit EIIC [Cetobacterium somerae]|uniref:fructose-specific PTS transporter subunit EIIC n=1 Tax=Cetobacterium somerae TaxID=188913 RepID=UPI002E7B3A47|nr:fructose-specific PTS transporter subunit EIIC [Cetobacterium somerae]WVJ02248.1 fructose-specific PTS transporter subunit EIIC [Cetobacterium somerae]